MEDVVASVHKIMGLVFFGRRDTISILDCYLKRNLARNGGILDGAIFVERTTDPFDLAFLEELLLSHPDYERWKFKRPNQSRKNGDYSVAYDRIQDNVMYIKIDDDIVFMEDNTIPSLVQTKATRPDVYVASANVVNQPLMSWVHWGLGAVKPYFPELPREFHFFFNRSNWRPSSLPKAEYDPYGPGWRRWQIAAQQHYSFFEHLENNKLWRYKFNMWDFQTKRMGIQLVAMMGRDINAAKPIPKDDEFHFGITMPRKLGRLAVADGRGVAAHYSFRTQLTSKAMAVLDQQTS